MQSNSSGEKTVKPLKIATWAQLLYKKRLSMMGHVKNEKQIFVRKQLTKADYKLSKTFYFIKKSIASAVL